MLLSRKWALDVHDAEDVAQEFFARALKKNWFSRYDANRGRFRTFLRTCLKAFAADEHDRANRLKRGGAAPHQSLSEFTALPERENAMDELFEQEWNSKRAANCAGWSARRSSSCQSRGGVWHF